MPDVLSEILKLIRLSGTVYFQIGFSTPWGMDMDKGKFAQFHIVAHGKCWAEAESLENPILLKTGDVIAFPHGESHSIADSLGSKKISGKAIYDAYLNNKLPSQNETCDARLICGHFEFDSKFEHPFLRELPSVIHIKGSKHKHNHLQNIIAIIEEETTSKEFASNIVTDRLAEILFINLLREYIAQNIKNRTPWLALSNHQIHKALQLIHENFGTSMTLAGIAREIGMSRSLFAERFRECVGTTPMQYLTQWRMHQAKHLLKRSESSINSIAQKVGYISEPAFNRAFKRQFEQTPGKFRKQIG